MSYVQKVVIGDATLYLGDCLDVLKTLPTNSVDSVVCDPPYGLSFMGKKWDYDVPSVEIWAECLRVLKPGGHLLAFAGTRTQHRMAVRIEDAGFEIRDMIAWVYGSGFPKSLDVSKAIDKAAGEEREVVGVREGFAKRAGLAERPNTANAGGYANPQNAGQITAPATDAARQWQGWGTALKPALEPITMARKPLVGTVAANVLEHGTGALNIDGCRVATGDKLGGGATSGHTAAHEGYRRPWMDNRDHLARHAEKCAANVIKAEALGRWPANLIHDGSGEVLAAFPETAPSKAANRGIQQRYDVSSPETARPKAGTDTVRGHGDNGGSAARFFYCAKASKRDRDEGLEGFEAKPANSAYGDGLNTATKVRTEEQAESGVSRDLRRNIHPTVKPTDLMAYLCRLVTPPGGVVLDPFMGSGSTGKAAIPEGFHFIGVECEPAYFDIACRRIEQAHAQGQLFAPERPKQEQEALL